MGNHAPPAARASHGSLNLTMTILVLAVAVAVMAAVAGVAAAGVVVTRAHPSKPESTARAGWKGSISWCVAGHGACLLWQVKA